MIIRPQIPGMMGQDRKYFEFFKKLPQIFRQSDLTRFDKARLWKLMATPVLSPRRIVPCYYICRVARRSRFADFVEIGIKSVINCRPENERQPFTPEEGRIAAEQHGLAYAHTPVMDRNAITDEEVERFVRAFKRLPGPAVGFCGSGLRAVLVWALYEITVEGIPYVLDRTANARIDLTPFRPQLEARLARLGLVQDLTK